MDDLKPNPKAASRDSSVRPPTKTNNLRRYLLGAGLACILLVLVAPQIAALTFVPGLIRTALQRNVSGEVSVSGVHLSWFWGLRIDSIRIASSDDATVLQAAIEIDRSALDLMSDSTNLGIIQVDVSGKAGVRKDGSVTFSQLLKPSGNQGRNDSPAIIPDLSLNSDMPESVEETSAPQPFMPRGLDLDVHVDISRIHFSMPEGAPDIHVERVQLQASIASSGRMVVDMVDMPASILGLYGDSSQAAVAALGEKVSGNMVLNPESNGVLEIILNVESPYAHVVMPMATFDGARFVIPEIDPLRGDLKISKRLSTEILSVIHPIFASIETTQRPIEVVLGPVDTEMNSGLTQINATGEIRIGEVMLSSTALGSQILSMIEGRAAERLAARFGPLHISMAKGRIGYTDFVVDIGRRDDGSYVQSFVFSGEINLESDPPHVLAISASYPGSNLVSFFPELKSVPPVLLDTLRPTVTFYGALFDEDGNRIPLKSRVEPFDIESTLRPDNLRNIFKGVGELLQR